MCGNNCFGNNNWWWIIILVLLLCNCGCGGSYNNDRCGCGSWNNDRCDNNCGCC